MSIKDPEHPILSLGNLIEGFAGLVAIAAGISILIATAGSLSAWISLTFAVTTTIIAFMSSYSLWFSK